MSTEGYNIGNKSSRLHTLRNVKSMLNLLVEPSSGGGGKGWGVVKWGEEHEQREAESQRQRTACRSL